MDYFKRLYLAKICPACGYRLDFTPWFGQQATDLYCACCGIHFGVDDARDRNQAYEAWRRRWVEDGTRWWSSDPVPSDFDPYKQLSRILETIEQPAMSC